MDEPSPHNHYLSAHAQWLCASFLRWTGRELIQAGGTQVPLAEALFKAPFAVVSHGTESDPIFNYANHTALGLFEMTWAEFVQLPSRYSAESPNQDERARLLAQVSERGFSDNYRGVRISASGRRFEIKNAVIWNLVNEEDLPCGQAAMFSDWTYI